MTPCDALSHLVCGTDWEGASWHALPGDASRRRYWRVGERGMTAIVMDSSHDEPVEPYIAIAGLLKSAGLRAPAVYRALTDDRWALVEDLGERIVARVLDEGADPKPIYSCAIDNLTALQQAAPPDWLPEYDDAFLMQELDIYLEHSWKKDSAIATREFREIWAQALPKVRVGTEVIVHRDFHTENLIWLDDETGLGRLGILDFQGARRGPMLYDVMSLLEDVRRPVAPKLRDSMFDYYLNSQPALEDEAARASYAILSAQRNLKILGIFERLAQRDGKLLYTQLVPRVRSILQSSLAHPSLDQFKAWHREYDPDP